jgi:hypothetical protein
MGINSTIQNKHVFPACRRTSTVSAVIAGTHVSHNCFVLVFTISTITSSAIDIRIIMTTMMTVMLVMTIIATISLHRQIQKRRRSIRLSRGVVLCLGLYFANGCIDIHRGCETTSGLGGLCLSRLHVIQEYGYQRR